MTKKKNKNKNLSSHKNVIKKKMADAIGSRIAGPCPVA
jgi:hypothetical protein